MRPEGPGGHHLGFFLDIDLFLALAGPDVQHQRYVGGDHHEPKNQLSEVQVEADQQAAADWEDEEDQLDHQLGKSPNQSIHTGPHHPTNTAYLSDGNHRDVALIPKSGAHDDTDYRSGTRGCD